MEVVHLSLSLNLEVRLLIDIYCECFIFQIFTVLQIWHLKRLKQTTESVFEKITDPGLVVYALERAE